MQLKELTLEEFQNFYDKHPLRNYCQTINYALVMGQFDYNYELIGLVDNDHIYAASIILIKRVGLKSYFAYAPKGFLVDYTDEELFTKFIDLIKKYYSKKNCIFIKINPEIAVGELNSKSGNIDYNNNYQINNILQKNGFINVGVNQDFDETLFPSFTGIVPLKDFGISKVSKNTRNKVRKAIRMGLTSKIGDINDLKIIKRFMPSLDDFYYEDFYNSFAKNNLVDVITVSIDPETYLSNIQRAFEKEQSINAKLAQRIINNNTNRNINKKMNSDRALLSYKNEIVAATNMLKENKPEIIAGAIVVKDGSRVQIIASGFNKEYKRFVPNYYLYYAILNYYKDEYLYADLNGISNNFSKDSKYHGLNRFKMGFNPKVYELIGEHDLILSPNNYRMLFDDSFISKIYKSLK